MREGEEECERGWEVSGRTDLLFSLDHISHQFPYIRLHLPMATVHRHSNKHTCNSELTHTHTRLTS